MNKWVNTLTGRFRFSTGLIFPFSRDKPHFTKYSFLFDTSLLPYILFGRICSKLINLAHFYDEGDTILFCKM